MSAPLSSRMSQLSELSAQRQITLAELENALEEKGAAAVICILCLPFLFPMPIPGISTIFGAAIILLSIKIIRGSSTGLPFRVGEKKIPSGLIKTVSDKSLRFILWIEKWIKPRASFVISGLGKWFAGISLISSSIALALPIPPIIPFTNTIPALGIFFVALGMMEEDGIMVGLGHLVGIAGWIYIAAVGGAAWVVFGELFQRLFT